MDNLTHSLAALMMSRAGLNRWCPRATALVILGANVPDADFVSRLAGQFAVLEWHRGPTHSILFSPLVALIPLALVWPFARRNMPIFRSFVVAWIGVLSHSLIDWTNMYGVTLFSPVSREWYALSINSFADIWIWAVLILAACWMVLSRLVTSEIGAAGASGRAVAIAALLTIVAYDFGRYTLRERARNVLDSRIYSGEEPQRVDALPTIGNPFRWQGLVETRSACYLFDIDLLERHFNPDSGRALYKPEFSPAIQSASEAKAFRTFLWWAKFPFWRTVPGDAEAAQGTTQVQVMDLRFGLPGEDAFVATAIVDSQNRVLRSWFQYGPPDTPPRFR